MSLDREEQMLVMQLADGELDGAEREQALRLVEAKPEAAALLAELGFVGDWARESQREGTRSPTASTSRRISRRRSRPASRWYSTLLAGMVAR